MRPHRRLAQILALLLVSLPLTVVQAAPDGPGFTDIAGDPAVGLRYERVPSATNTAYQRIQHQPLYTMPLVVATPEKPRGAPGVALLDFDGDGDLDIFVTNGPGAPHSLFANRLVEKGRLVFEDVATAAGVAAPEQDGTGVCFGDLDNDGDPDLLVLGRSEPNRLFLNRGDGTFADATAGSGLGDDDLAHTSCSLGDVDGDGLLDVAIANSYDWSYRGAMFAEPWKLNQPNQLFLNRGQGHFEDVSESSGIRRLAGLDAAGPEPATVTWELVLVDIDQDGDADLVQADDQGAVPPSQGHRGLLHVLLNDGSGHFTDHPPNAGTGRRPSSWMGLSFADFNCDGRMDLFATNMGDYVFSALGFPFERGDMSSRWFLGKGGGRLEDPGLGDLRATSFGWSVVTPDYDLDGDPDVLYYGSLDAALHTITADNPGIVLENQGCGARFVRRSDLLPLDHARRNVQGAATGDLDGDGRPDVVSVSAFDIPEDVPLHPYPASWDSPFDATARYVEVFHPAGNGAFTWNGYQFPNGHLAVEINHVDNGNGWVAVRTLGTVGLVDGGRVNRDGIGAVVSFTPEGGASTLRPVLGGASYASEDSLTLIFGLGQAERGTLEVLWPGGVRNRLTGVARGERVLFPEIPCSFDGELDPGSYHRCVDGALRQLVERGRLTAVAARRFASSALEAYREARAERVAAEARAAK